MILDSSNWGSYITTTSIGAATASHTHSELSMVEKADENEAKASSGKVFGVYTTTTGTHTSSGGDGYVMSFNWSNQYATQIAVDLDPTYNLAIRGWKNDATGWREWKNILTANNSSVSLSGNTLTVKINGTEKSLTNTDTWRGITDSYSGTSSDVSLSQKGANDLYSTLLNGYATSSGNSDTVDGFHIMSSNGTAYKYQFSITCPLEDITGDYWYVKLTINRGWNPEISKCVLKASYSNINGITYMDIIRYVGEYRRYTTDYVGSNISGIAMISGAPNNVYWIELKKPAEYGGSIEGGNFSIYCNYSCTLELYTEKPSGISFDEVSGNSYYDQQMFSSFYSSDNKLSATIAGKTREVIVGYASSAPWSGITSKPETATRWPTWSEVTDKPSTFTPSSHTHNYLPLTGGTLSANGVVLLTINNTASNAKVNGISFNLNGTCQTRLVAENGKLYRTDSTWSNQYTIWDSGSDGANSGLDADLLDGNHASAFASSGHNHDSVYLAKNGAGVVSYSTVDSFILRKTSNYSAVIRFEGLNESNSTNTALGYLGFNNVNTPVFRNTSGNYYKIWHEGNDGSGSGLDADLLDGYHLSSILVAKESQANGDANACTTMGSYWLGDGHGQNIPMTYAQVTTLNSGSNWGLSQFAAYNSKLYFRTSNNSTVAWADWKKVAFIDSTVAAAESVPWSGITGKPSTFTPSDHEHRILKIEASAQDNAVPSTSGTYFKVYSITDNTLSASTGDGYIMAFNYSNQYATQIAVDLDPTYRLAIRGWKSGIGWNTWSNILTENNSSVSLSGNTLTVKINGTEKSLTNTWRGITDSYSGTSTDTSLSQKGANTLYNTLLNGYASSAGSVGGYNITGSDSFLYRYSSSTSFATPQMTGDYWYVKIEMSRHWVSEVSKCRLAAAYSNICGVVYMEIVEFPGKWRAYTTSYCGCNILGIAYVSGVPNVYWIKLRKPTEYSGSIPDGSFGIYSQYQCTLTAQATEPSGVSFTTITAGTWYDPDLSMTNSEIDSIIV